MQMRVLFALGAALAIAGGCECQPNMGVAGRDVGGAGDGGGQGDGSSLDSDSGVVGDDGGGSGDDGGTPDADPGCGLRTCTTAGAKCGEIGDGCNSVLYCGGCNRPEFCGGGGVANQCGGKLCNKLTCTDFAAGKSGKACGPISDNCGGEIDCGGCAAGDQCGMGGTSICGKVTAADGGAICVPKTCADQGISCGAAGDGCNGQIPGGCGSCTSPDFCGGGGPGKCGRNGVGADGGTATCVPKTCKDLGFDCGPAFDGCGGQIPGGCGTCTGNAFCGGGGPSKCGTTVSPDAGAVCPVKTCLDQGITCGPASNGCGALIASCGPACTAPDICGGGGVPGQCGGTTAADGGVSCTGLCQNQVNCGANPTTTITGRVTAPGHVDTVTWGSPDPIYNALVYVPNGTVQPFTAGVACDQCAKATGNPLVSTNSAPDGTFTLTNVPAGVSFPVVVQLGRWRRTITVGPVTACQTLNVGDLRLPRNQQEGEIPLIAIATGRVDTTECVLRKMGVDDAEFTSSAGNGRIRLYPAYNKASCAGTGAGQIAGPTGGANACALTASLAELKKHDMVIFSCVGSAVTQTATDQQNVVDYANAGGRIFSTHFSYVWMDKTSNANSAWAGVANWAGNNSNFGDAPLTATVNANPGGIVGKGVPFQQWLTAVGASTTNGSTVDVGFLRDNQCGIVPQTPPWGLDWINIPAPNGSPCTSTTNNVTVHMTWNTPAPAPGVNQCGRALFSDFHVSNASVAAGDTFPTKCTTGPLTAQEKVLEYMLFDLSSCIVPDVPPPPTCVKKTCQELGIGCGPAPDGCGGQQMCPPCNVPDTCGGGGVAFQCGHPTCVKKTCQELGIGCGLAPDGCGGQQTCPPCTLPDTCGGGGVNFQCGHLTCAPKSCIDQNIGCGPAGNGCGGPLDCGPCTTPDTCGGGGVAFQCGHTAAPCKPKTCTDLGLSCGPAGDGCGGPLSCGQCSEPFTCGGGGVPGVCGRIGCPISTSCQAQGAECGPITDGCGGTIQCPACPAGQTCGGGGVANKCGGAMK